MHRKNVRKKRVLSLFYFLNGPWDLRNSKRAGKTDFLEKRVAFGKIFRPKKIPRRYRRGKGLFFYKGQGGGHFGKDAVVEGCLVGEKLGRVNGVAFVAGIFYA